MRKLIASALLPGVLAACSEANDATISNVPEEEAPAAVALIGDAESYGEKLVAAGLPLADIVVVTEETDDNRMLGRPGQYSSKIYFVDERHRGEGFEPNEQNSIEVFGSEEDATKRREYVQSVIDEMPMFNQYIIQSGSAVMRLDKAITPSEARAYEAALGA